MTSGGQTIGSDFASPSKSWMRATPTPPPWEFSGESVAYLRTGRQALTWLTSMLTERGIERVLLPDYLCESMIEPFVSAGWTIETYALDSGFRFRPADLVDQVAASPAPTAVLTAAYFGNLPTEDHASAVRSIREHGAVVIEDETHRVFTPGGVEADVSFGSLRKLLPVADGAYVRADDDLISAGPVAAIADSSRWAAMDAKSQLGGLPVDEVRDLFLVANAELEETTAPSPASARTLGVLELLDYELLANRRRRNAELLMRELTGHGISIINEPSSRTVSGFVVVSVARPRELQSKLAAQRMFCPIHWPKPSALSAQVGWRYDLLSLPVDHRYEEADMIRLAAAVARETGR